MEAVQEVTISGVATKEDVQSIKEDVQSVRDDMHNLEIGLRAEIQKIDAKIDKKIDDQKIWFLGAMLTQTFALVAVILTVAFRVL